MDYDTPAHSCARAIIRKLDDPVRSMSHTNALVEAYEVGVRDTLDAKDKEIVQLRALVDATAEVGIEYAIRIAGLLREYREARE